MYANYHTHTALCGHAWGTEREYIESAIAAGCRILGFSDHSPYLYPDDYVSFIRMRMEQLEDYVTVLSDLRAEYRDQIEIHIGLEAEYYPRLFPLLLNRLRGYPIEYLLLGQHNTNNEYDGVYAGTPTEDPAVLKQYCSQCRDAMQTGLFTCFAHPDLMQFTGSETLYRQEMGGLCKEAKACGLPLEFNLLGFRQQRHYPTPLFWELAAEEGNSVILGCDAHGADALNLPELEAQAREILGGFGLTPLKTAPILSIQR